MTTCPNGHPIAEGQPFCSECGAEVISSGVDVPAAASEGTEAIPIGSESATVPSGEESGKNKVVPIVAGAAIVVLVLIVGLLVATHHTSNSTVTATTGAVTPTTSALDTCSLNLSDWTIFLSNYGSGLEDARLTYGLNSPIFTWLYAEQATFREQATSQGQGAAQGTLQTDATMECQVQQQKGVDVGQVPPPPSSPGDPAPTFNGAATSSPTTTPTASSTQSGSASATHFVTTPPAPALAQALDNFFSVQPYNTYPLSELMFTAAQDPSDPTWAVWNVGGAPGFQSQVSSGYGFAQLVNGYWEVVAGPGSAQVGCPPPANNIPNAVLAYFGVTCP